MKEDIIIKKFEDLGYTYSYDDGFYEIHACFDVSETLDLMIDKMKNILKK